MIFPFESLSGAQREAGLVVGALVGFGFGFVLERAGFGRAQKLAAQFYGTDLTVLKVMFGAIVTALAGMVLLSGIGLVDFVQVADSAASGTFLWPMIAGGFALGVGFIVSGYCPGTSFVAAASGKLDGLVTVLGVIAGQVIYAELEGRPWLAKFHTSGDLGQFYLWDWLHLPRAVVAAAVIAMAVGAFFAAEKIEKARSSAAAPEAQPCAAGRPGRVVYAGLGLAALSGLAALALPGRTEARPQRLAQVGQMALAVRLLEQPWTVRVIDLRPLDQCAARRLPTAECVPVDKLASLQLADAPPTRDIVLVAEGELAEAPAAARGFKGRLSSLQGGFAGWREFALTAPPPTLPDRDLYRARAAIHAAMTGMKAAPPPPPPSAGPGPKKGGGGGCGG